MRPQVFTLVVIALVCMALVEAYLLIKPALHLAILTSAALALFFYCLKPATAHAMAPSAFCVGIGMPLIAWTLPSIWLLYLVMIGLVPLVAHRLNRIAPMYIFSLLLLPGLDTTIALGSVRLFEFGVHDSLAVGATIAVLLNRQRRSRIGRQLDLPAVAIVLLIVAALSRETSITNVLRVFCNATLDLALPYFIVSRTVRTIDDVRSCMLWLACGGAVLSSILAYEVWKFWPIYNELYGQYDIPTLLLVKARGGMLRAGGPFVEATSIAMVLTTCILAAWLSGQFFRSRLHHIGLLLLLLVGLSAPQSRGAWIGLILGIALADVYRGRYGRIALRFVPILLIGMLLVSLAQFSPYLHETLGMSGGSSASGEYRKLLLDRGLEEFRNSPIIGYSVPDLWIHLSDLKQGEGIIDFVNTYIWIMLISGGVGLAIFVGGFVFFLGKLWQLRRGAAAIPGYTNAAAFAFAGLAIPMEMLFFTSFGGRPTFFIFLLFGFAAVLIAMRGKTTVRASSLSRIEKPKAIEA